MMSTKAMLRACLSLAMFAALAACGGGGGGDKPAPTPDDTNLTPSSAPGLQLSTQQLRVSSEHGDTEIISAIDGVVNNATAPVYVQVSYTNSALSSVWFNSTSDIGGRLMLMHKPAASLTPGSYTDSVLVRVCYDNLCNRHVTGSPKTVNISYTVEAAAPPSAIMLSHEGVAFTKAPFGSRLSQQVSVTQSGTAPGPWTASTTASWLQVTASGQAGAPLQLTADPQGLAPGQYMTWVTVQASSPANTRPAAIRVGLYVSGTASAAAFANTLGNQPQNDPARPLVYSLNGGGIVIDHLYTGQRLATLSVPGRQLSEMHVSRNGNRILATDADGTRVWMLNTDTQAIEGNYVLPPQKPTSGETRRTPFVLKVNGRNVMVVVGLSPSELRGGYYMVDLDTGLPLPSLFTAATGGQDELHMSPDGRHFLVVTYFSPNSMLWGTLNENSKGVVYQDSRTGGTLWGVNRTEYLNSDLSVGVDPQDSFTCQGSLTQYLNSPYVTLDEAWFDHVTWQNTQPVYVGTDFNKRCRGVERYEDDLLLISDQLMSELQLRQRDGTLVRTWAITSGLAGMRLSSDQLRVFDNSVMQDLPR